ncbi:CobW family GTP-binding protein [Mycolicibacterium mengxianglii]|uniref:CobW family GTP-binding protein n=1 Tax=Mycolicibacterium mengxianglii TaxID=2736649 RepID=UPI0018EF176C|nr:GTP-binding protein [Mycolicibacterium mengxianglii]
MGSIPVIAVTGYLGAGKTSLLNHVLRTPHARIGVVVNDFGDINVDAGLVSGQVDEPASIAGGCICCLPDDGELDAALARLADPKLRLDAIIIEASGLADPVSLARMVGFSGVEGVRDGGVIDVVDAATHFEKVDDGVVPPARYGAATLVVVNKLDQLPESDRETTVRRIEQRVHQRNPRAQVVGAVGGRIDPALLYDVAAARDEYGQLSFRDALFDLTEPDETPHHHVHADSVTVTSAGDVDPDAVLDMLESPPAGVYRLKGTVAVRHRSRTRAYVVNVVGPSVHLRRGDTGTAANTLVAIGMHLDMEDVRSRLSAAVAPSERNPSPAALRRLQRYLGR